MLSHYKAVSALTSPRGLQCAMVYDKLVRRSLHEASRVGDTLMIDRLRSITSEKSPSAAQEGLIRPNTIDITINEV